MKKLYVFTIMLFFAANISAQNISLESGKLEENLISVSVEDFNLLRINTPKGVESVLSVSGFPQIMEKGYPDLAKLFTNIIIPDTDEMQLKVISYNYKEYYDVEIAPSKGHFDRSTRPEDVPFVYGDIYEQDTFWPEALAVLEDPFILRDFRGQTVSIYPFQYNAVKKTLRVYSEIVLEITSTGNVGKNSINRTKETIILESEFGKIYTRFFLNYDIAEKSYPLLEGEEGSLLIICHNDFMEEMEPFVNWKRTIGRETEIVSTNVTGTSAADIKGYVSNYYQDNSDFAYLLLIGGASHIATHNPNSYGGSSDGGSDNYYTFLVGSDSYNDIFIGRFSGENASHIETQVQRMIEYERDLDESDTWLNVGMGVARNEGTGGGHYGEADYVHMEFVKDTLLNYTYNVVHSEYDHNAPGFPNTTAANISSNINNGVSIINYCNHGSNTGWSVAGYGANHVNNDLTNVGKLPFIWSVACVNGNFHFSTCFAETWLRATHNGEPTGAVGMLASTINQAWQPPMCGQDEMNSILTEESIVHGSVIKRTFGGISANGSMYMIPQYGASGIATHETWTLFGDPTLMVRTDVPTSFNPNYAPQAMIGWDSFTVSDVDAGATIAITKVNSDGEVEILGTAISNGGSVDVIFEDSLDEPGFLTLAITGFNKVTYINDEIEVTADGAYANFAGEPRTVVIGESVTFTDTSDPDAGTFTSWTWNFGAGADPATATGQGPHTVTYNSPGQKNVSLNVNHSTEGALERVRDNYITVKDIFTLTVNFNGSGTVEVDGVPYSEPLSVVESQSYSLEAFPADYWHFSGWSGDVSSYDNPVNISIDSDKTITANFLDCSSISLPFEENFNASTDLPLCWEIIDHQGNGQVWQFGTHANGLSGTTGNYAYLNSDGFGSGNTQNTDLIMPTINLSNYTDVNLEFTHHFRPYQSSSGTVSYSIDDGETWTDIETWTGSQTANPAYFSQVIPEVEGQPNVKFKWNYSGTWGYYWDVDDIVINGEVASGVINPSNFNATAISDSQIDLSWTKNIDNDNVMIAVNSTSSFGVPEGSYSVDQNISGGGTIIYRDGGTSYSHENVEPYTTYYYRIWSYNDEDLYSGGVSNNETTPCGVFTEFPYTETFDGGDGNCWMVEDTAVETWELVPSYTTGGASPIIINPVSGSHYFRCQYHETQSQNEWLISPVFNFSTLANPEMTFSFNGSYTWSVAPNPNCDLDLYVRVDQGDWVQIWNQTDHPDFNSADIDWTWLEETIELNAYSGQNNVQFAFVYSGMDGGGFGIDDLEIFGSGVVTPGDVNGDENVNILDVVWLVRYLLDDAPDGFIEAAGDLTNTGTITPADLTKLIDVILEKDGEDRNPDSTIQSERAYISVDNEGLASFTSDGTLLSLHFEISVDNLHEVNMNLLFNNDFNTKHRVSFNENTGKGIIYSLSNCFIPQGNINLLEISNFDISSFEWGDVLASNTNHQLVLVSSSVMGSATSVFDNLADKFDVNVFPNPNTGNFAIKLSIPDDLYLEIELIDERGRVVSVSGRTLYSRGEHLVNSKTNQLLSNGLYVLRVKAYDAKGLEIGIKHEEKIMIIK